MIMCDVVQAIRGDGRERNRLVHSQNKLQLKYRQVVAPLTVPIKLHDVRFRQPVVTFAQRDCHTLLHSWDSTV